MNNPPLRDCKLKDGPVPRREVIPVPRPASPTKRTTRDLSHLPATPTAVYYPSKSPYRQPRAKRDSSPCCGSGGDVSPWVKWFLFLAFFVVLFLSVGVLAYLLVTTRNDLKMALTHVDYLKRRLEAYRTNPAVDYRH